MPTLNWIGKEKVINYHNEVPFRLLNEKKKFSVNTNNTENLLIKGDNLEALKALLPYYYNKIKAIYIDPPYNTGNEKWIYNDNVNSPEMKKWLGKVVGSEGEDLSRHDKWLCMMYPRLKLLRDLLSYDGVIFVSIDDNEVHHLRLLMDEVFQGNIEMMIWRKSGEGRYGKMKNTMTTRNDHEYIIVGYKGNTALNKIRIFPNFQSKPKRDARGEFWTGYIARGERGSNKKHRNYYMVISPNGIPFQRQFEVSKEEFDRLNKAGYIYWTESGIPYRKIYKNKPREIICSSILLDVGSTYHGRLDFEKIFYKRDDPQYPNPKPVNLIKRLIELTTDKNQRDIVLDSFVGSGTTGQAVLELNKEDGGNRKFILVEMEDKICREITAERLKRVIQGYSYKKSNGEEVKVEGLGGGFKFLELGKPLFDRHRQIIGQPSYEDLAGYIYFTETHNTIDREKANRDDWYIGENGGVHYFIIYEGKGKSELGEEFLKIAKRYKGEKIVYADTLMLDDDELEKYDIVFKQTPYGIKTF